LRRLRITRLFRHHSRIIAARRRGRDASPEMGFDCASTFNELRRQPPGHASESATRISGSSRVRRRRRRAVTEDASLAAHLFDSRRHATRMIEFRPADDQTLRRVLRFTWRATLPSYRRLEAAISRPTRPTRCSTISRQ
jgi:hypothetical protein